jgi:hypothetical protein
VLTHACFSDFEEIMPFSHWLAAVALAFLPFAAIAAQTHRQPDPHDANVAVPASGYDSAFNRYRGIADEKESPDKVWRRANEEIQNPDAHADQMTDSGSDSPSSTPADGTRQGPHHSGGK